MADGFCGNVDDTPQESDSMVGCGWLRLVGKISAGVGMENRRRFSRAVFLVSLLTLAGMPATGPGGQASSEGIYSRIAEKIYQNECGGDAGNLVAWNEGERFLSLGIGHFIWYPPGVEKEYVESFQELARFARRQGEPLPGFTAGACPWPDRKAFGSSRGTPERQRLENLMQATFALQTRFLVFRLHNASIQIRQSLPSGQRDEIAEKHRMLAETAAGLYAMVDYVNFKGEGLLPGEAIQGEGWGLKQVLLNMRMPSGGADAVAAFAVSAEQVLERRVQRDGEQSRLNRWLPGWRNRVRSYVRAFL